MLVWPDSNSRSPTWQPEAQPTEPPVRGLLCTYNLEISLVKMPITGNEFRVITTYLYFLNGQALERTDAHPCLGVIISSDLRLNNHCDFVFKRSSLSCAPFSGICLLCMGSYTQRNISNLEKVQQRVPPFVFRDYYRNSIVSYKLNVLGWPLLFDLDFYSLQADVRSHPHQKRIVNRLELLRYALCINTNTIQYSLCVGSAND